LTGCFVAHRSKTTAGILPLRFAHPAKIRSSATTPVTDLVHWGTFAAANAIIEKKAQTAAKRFRDTS
jgi:hypothetical protein